MYITETSVRKTLYVLLLFAVICLCFVVLISHTASASSNLTIDSHKNGQAISGETVRVSGSYTDIYDIELVINGMKVVDVHMVDPDGDDAGIWYYDVDTSDYDGQTEWIAKGSDANTRYTVWSDFVNVSIENPDAHIPTVSIENPVDGASVKNGAVKVQVSVNAKNPVEQVQVRINGGEWQDAKYKKPKGYYEYKWLTHKTWKAKTDGKTCSIEARAIDLKGNVGRSLTTYAKVKGGTKETTTALKQDRAMWIWENASYNLILNEGSRTVLDAMAKDETTFDQDQVTTLYLGVDKYYGIDMLEDERSKVRDFVGWAHDNGYQVHALIAGGTHPPYFGAYTRYHEHALREFEKVLNYNISSEPNERFDGVNIDIEPYIASDFKSDKPSVQVQYLDILQKMIQRRNIAGYRLLVGPAIPRWYDSSEHAENITWNGSTKWLSEHIQDISDYISIMDYRDEAGGSAGIIQQAQGEIDYANQIGKPNSVVIGVETKDIADGGDPETITFREEGRAYMEGELDKVYAAFGTNNAFAGIAMHHYDTIRYLPSEWGPKARFWEPPEDTIAPSGLSEDPVATTFDFQRIDLSYGRASDNTEIEEYNIYRSTTSGFEPGPGHLAGTSRGLSFVDTGLLPNTTYYYKVAAVDVAGNIGPPSAEISAVTEDTSLKPMIISNMDVTYDGVKGKVSLQVVDKNSNHGIQAAVHGRFTYMSGTYVSDETATDGTMTATSGTVTEDTGKIGFEPKRVMADGYYWASAYDQPHSASVSWSYEDAVHVSGGR